MEGCLVVVGGWTGEAVVVECFMPGGGRVGLVCSRVQAASFPMRRAKWPGTGGGSLQGTGNGGW